MASDPRTDVCVHCGVEVRTINYALGPELRHSTYPYRTRDTYWHCKQTVATLVAPLAGQHTTDEETDRAE